MKKEAVKETKKIDASSLKKLGVNAKKRINAVKC